MELFIILAMAGTYSVGINLDIYCNFTATRIENIENLEIMDILTPRYGTQ
jgi:hypothetical protein